ncbi:MAG: cellulase family glycosylhydrolase, partial [Planctomycetes bacterium]|nr:cellulase family glycosylhydrolase [Planctomycetota bacterium]
MRSLTLVVAAMAVSQGLFAAQMPFIEIDPATTTAFREHGTGRPFVAVGLNYFDHETGWAPKLWQQFDEVRVRDQLRLVSEQGFNAIRLFITLESFEREAGQVTAEGEAKFRKLLDLCRQCSIYVIPTGPERWEGAPAWCKGDRFANEAMLAAEAAWWTTFAGRFADEPAILAWDLANEPSIGWDSPEMAAEWNCWLEPQYGSADKIAAAGGVPADQLESPG